MEHMENLMPSQGYTRQLQKCPDTGLKHRADLKKWQRIMFCNTNSIKFLKNKSQKNLKLDIWKLKYI